MLCSLAKLLIWSLTICMTTWQDNNIRNFIINTVFYMFLEVISKWKSIRLVLLESLGVGVQSFSVCVDSLSCLAHYESEIENVGFDVLMKAVLNGRLVRLFFQRV